MNRKEWKIKHRTNSKKKKKELILTDRSFMEITEVNCEELCNT